MHQSEIKFRAWNQLTLDDGEMITEDNSGLKSYQILERFSLVMQWTGLKTEEGKEIYEDDILSYDGRFGNNIQSWYGGYSVGKGDVFVVKRLPSGYSLVPIDIWKEETELAPNRAGVVYNYFFWNTQRGLKVIGNIYENPELF